MSAHVGWFLFDFLVLSGSMALLISGEMRARREPYCKKCHRIRFLHQGRGGELIWRCGRCDVPRQGSLEHPGSDTKDRGDR